ncbi:MAG TPA: adenosylcobinamide-phosphate synthase CbiB [Herpetosiphonaceae bacterium]|nr:adenosylcobinamide-phosphate synthase CbiB [Herpetosiphonaceae bacterium]
MSHGAQRMLVALAVDASLGDPPNALHPVVAMGRWLQLGEQFAPSDPTSRLIWGAVWTCGGMGVSATVAALLPRHTLTQGAAASLLLSYRTLDRAVSAVQAALSSGDVVQARQLLGWHLVSRPTAELSAPDVAAAAIESLAENLSDSVVAPLCWYTAGGLPALAIYRFSNTADAMWGYHDARYEYLGKAAARIDDALNWAPARLTALLIALAAQANARRGSLAWRIARRDHAITPSPNAGWPMAAMAGALNTTLAKVGHYQLGDGPREPATDLIDEALRISRTIMLVIGAAVLAVSAAQSRRKEGV